MSIFATLYRQGAKFALQTQGTWPYSHNSFAIYLYKLSALSIVLRIIKYPDKIHPVQTWQTLWWSFWSGVELEEMWHYLLHISL